MKGLHTILLNLVLFVGETSVLKTLLQKISTSHLHTQRHVLYYFILNENLHFFKWHSLLKKAT